MINNLTFHTSGWLYRSVMAFPLINFYSAVCIHIYMPINRWMLLFSFTSYWCRWIEFKKSLNSYFSQDLQRQEQIHILFCWLTGWRSKDVLWDHTDIQWIKVMDHLMSLMFGQDFFEYALDSKKTCHVQDGFKSTFKYNREEWLHEYADMLKFCLWQCELSWDRYVSHKGNWWFWIIECGCFFTW